MKVGKVSNSFIISSLRLDGNFHLSEGLVVRAHIKKSPYGIDSIGDVTSDVYCPGIFKRNYTKNGIPFLGGSDIQKNYYDCGKYLKVSTTNIIFFIKNIYYGRKGQCTENLFLSPWLTAPG